MNNNNNNNNGDITISNENENAKALTRSKKIPSTNQNYLQFPNFELPEPKIKNIGIETSPLDLRRREDTTIQMADGCNLAARIWQPRGNSKKFPAILEYDTKWASVCSAKEDELRYMKWAKSGFVCVRVDIRGTGDSDINTDTHCFDEHTKQELDDSIAVIQWISEQEWCTGDVGMYGKGWGAYAALRVASLPDKRKPDALKTIITQNASVDRYTDNSYYAGECVLGATMLKKGVEMLAENARPPNPYIVGMDKWKELWKKRLDKIKPATEKWLQEQDKDSQYWKESSLIDDLENIKIPVFLWDGWNSSSKNSVFQILQKIPEKTVRNAVIGQWGNEGPQGTGYLEEMLTWWNKFLREYTPLPVDQPIIRAFLSTYEAAYVPKGKKPSLKKIPITNPSRVAGKWIGEMNYTKSESIYRDLALTGERELLEDGNELKDKNKKMNEYIKLPYHPENGSASGATFSNGLSDLPGNQYRDDKYSLCFSTKPMAFDVEIFGRPKVFLHLLKSQKSGMLALRLNLIDPNNAAFSLLLSRAVVNIPYNDGKSILNRLEFEMDAMGFVVPKGFIVRLSISPNYFPYAWSTIETPNIRIAAGQYKQSKISLPMFSSTKTELDEASKKSLDMLFEKSEPISENGPIPENGLEIYTMRRNDNQENSNSQSPLPIKIIEPPFYERRQIRIEDEEGERYQTKITDNTKKWRMNEVNNNNNEINISYNEDSAELYEIDKDDPLSAKANTSRKIYIHYEDPNDSSKSINAEINVSAELTGDKENYKLKHKLKVLLNNKLFDELLFETNIERKYRTVDALSI